MQIMEWLNLCICEGARNPDVISEAHFKGNLDGIHFLSALKDHLKEHISLTVDLIR